MRNEVPALSRFLSNIQFSQQTYCFEHYLAILGGYQLLHEGGPPKIFLQIFFFVKTNIFQATKPQNTRHQLFLLRTNNILKPWLTIIIATQPIPKKPGKSESFPPSRGAGAAAKKGGNMKVGDEKYFSQKHICCSDWDANERWRLGLLQVRLLHQVRSRHPEGPLNLQQSRRCTASSLLCLHNMESSTFEYKFSTQNKTDSLMIRTNI